MLESHKINDNQQVYFINYKLQRLYVRYIILLN